MHGVVNYVVLSRTYYVNSYANLCEITDLFMNKRLVCLRQC